MSEIFFISALAFSVVEIAVFIFIIAPSALSAARSISKQKTIVYTGLAALAIWFAVACWMLFILVVSQPAPDEFRGDSFIENYGGYLAFAGLVIYIFDGIGLGFWIKGRTKWRTSATLK